MHKLAIPHLLLSSLALALLAGCSEPKPTSSALSVSGFSGMIQVSASNPDELPTLASATSNQLHGILTTLDDTDPKSELAKLNRLAANARIPLSASTFRILDMAHYYSIITSNAYDVTMGPVQDLWKAGTPDPKELIDAISRTSMQFVNIADAGSVTFSRPDLSIRLGLTAHAYALDIAAANVKHQAAGPFAISSASMLRRERDFPEHEMPTLPLAVSSGPTIGKFRLAMHPAIVIQHAGINYPVIDPRDGRPARGGITAAVAGKLATKACALAEALLVLGPEDGQMILPAFEGYDFLLITSAEPFEAVATTNFLAHSEIASKFRRSIRVIEGSGGLESGERGTPLVEGLSDDRAD